MPSEQALTVPQAQAMVLNPKGVFTAVWYRFFQSVAQEIPQIGDCSVQAAGPVTSDALVCDGTTVSRMTYVQLFAVIGIAYGAGDGMTTFGLPNFVSPGAPSFWKIRFQ